MVTHAETWVVVEAGFIQDGLVNIRVSLSFTLTFYVIIIFFTRS